MASIATKLPNPDNEVTRRLKAGNGQIAGLKLFVAVDDLALIPVTTKGIDFYGMGSLSRAEVLILVTPVGGRGKLWVRPTQLIDVTPAAVDLFQRKVKAQEAYNKVREANSDRARRSAVLAIRDKMTEAQRELFAQRLPDRLGEKATTDPVGAVNKTTGEYSLNAVAELAAQILFDVLDAGPEYED